MARGSGPAVAQLGARRPPGRRAGQPARHGRRLAGRRRRPPTPTGFAAAVDALARPQGLQHPQRLLHRPLRAPTSWSRCSSTPWSGPASGAATAASCTSPEREAADAVGAGASTGVPSCAAPRAPVEEALAETAVDETELGREWEWEETPEVTLKIVDDVDEAVALFNRYSPRFVASLISEDAAAHDALLRRGRRALRRRRLHPLGRRPVRARTGPSSACPTGSTAACSPAAGCCRATACSPSACGWSRTTRTCIADHLSCSRYELMWM